MERMTSAPRRRRVTSALLNTAQLGLAHWFFGNLYEAVVKVPDRLADDPQLTLRSARITPQSLLRQGSPVRYYLPGAPIALGAGPAALVAGWASLGARRWLAASAAGSLTGGVVTGYIVRGLNTKLFFAAEQPDRVEREALLRRWHRLNAVRLLASAVALFATHRARARIDD